MISSAKKNFFFIFIVFIIFSLSYQNSAPIYGKLKFIFLNTFWPNLRILGELKKNQEKLSPHVTIHTDPVSGYTLNAIGNINSDFKIRLPSPVIDISIQSLLSKSNPPDTACLINLKGFPDTWVPRLTGHWDPIISNTARFYEHNGYQGKKLAITLENEFKDKCIVLKDKELPWDDGENFRYRIPNLNYTGQQEDIHILQFKKDSLAIPYNVLIDVGFAPQTKDKLLDYLAINEIYQLDEIYITHPHKDHYSGLYELIQFGIPIKKVWMNMPLKENCDREIPWGCDFEDLKKLLALMKEKGIEHSEMFQTNPKEPITLYSDSNNKLTLLFASPAISPQLGNMDINDLSMIMKLETNGTSYLFTGDLNKTLSEYLKGENSFRANILKVPHHGTEGVASNEFFNTVNASIGIVPSPQGLWCSERSSRIRNYFRVTKSKMYISGFHGDILVRHFKNKKYKVISEFEPERVCGEKIQRSFAEKYFSWIDKI